jgi:hypothetical protein
MEPESTVTDIATGLNLDGLIESVFSNPASIGVVIVLIISTLFFRKVGKKTRQQSKQQKQDVKVYKEQKKEDIKVIQKIDEDMKVIIEDLQKQNIKEDEIKVNIQKTIDKAVVDINTTKVKAGGRSLKETNDRLRNHLNRITDKNNKE